jgi:hypothetical protein
MSLGAALKKINARAKALKKKHPGKKYRTLQKQAGAEYKAGKLKTKRKKVGTTKKRKVGAKKIGAPRKRKRIGATRGNTSGNTRTATHAATSRNRTATSTKTITAHVKVGARKRRKSKPRYRVTHKVTRVSGIGKGATTALLIGGGLLAAYLLLKPKAVVPPLAATANPARVTAQNGILDYATKLGLNATSITALINALNSSDDTTVISAAANPASTVQPFSAPVADTGLITLPSSGSLFSF